jgi:cytochrome-b5 reductase
VSKVTSLTPTHVLVEIPVPPGSLSLFRTFEGIAPSTAEDVPRPPISDDEYAVIHHVCVKSPDLQIERPYTPINDVQSDRVIKIVVKRVVGGEVGR